MSSPLLNVAVNVNQYGYADKEMPRLTKRASRPPSIPFLDGFELVLSSDCDGGITIEQGLGSIGVLSSVAQDCSNLAGVLSEGGEPNSQMVAQAAYAACILNGLAEGVVGILKEIEESDMG